MKPNKTLDNVLTELSDANMTLFNWEQIEEIRDSRINSSDKSSAIKRLMGIKKERAFKVADRVVLDHVKNYMVASAWRATLYRQFLKLSPREE